MARLPARELAALAEAYVAVCVACVIVRLVPFRLYHAWPRRLRDGASPPPLLVRHVGKAVERAARNAPLDAACLAQALAAKAMLARRRYASVLHLGVARDDGALSAHAWLTAGEMTVVGGGGGRFSEVATFGP